MARDFRLAEHLPNRREGREPASPEELPRQRNGVTPQMHGRYPDYNVLDEARHWDEVTRRLVLDRVGKVPPIRFFTEAEARTLGAFCEVVMAQDREPRVPVLNMVDAKLFAGKLDGFRYAEMPDDRETWRRVALGLDVAAKQHRATSFAGASHEVQRMVIQAFSEGNLRGKVWDELPVARAWSVVMRGVLSEFYSHPWAWNEIGFGGPAYPRGYARLGAGQRESWEGAPAFETDPAKDAPRRGLG
jgi:Gluconate 2-dehydrogenase subunit 3